MTAVSDRPKHASGLTEGRAICEALGLDYRQTRGIEIRVQGGDAVQLSVEQDIFVEQLQKILGIVSEYNLCKDCEKCEQARRERGLG